ncbi:MAG: hypothetical protein AB1529_01980 [Candidatus Micrarchaeota archaeon]
MKERGRFAVRAPVVAGNGKTGFSGRGMAEGLRPLDAEGVRQVAAALNEMFENPGTRERRQSRGENEAFFAESLQRAFGR